MIRGVLILDELKEAIEASRIAWSQKVIAFMHYDVVFAIGKWCTPIPHYNCYRLGGWHEVTVYPWWCINCNPYCLSCITYLMTSFNILDIFQTYGLHASKLVYSESSVVLFSLLVCWFEQKTVGGCNKMVDTLKTFGTTPRIRTDHG